MRSEKDILADMERTNVVRKVYERQAQELQNIIEGDDGEVSRQLQSTRRAITRTERTLNRLNKELGKHIGDQKREGSST